MRFQIICGKERMMTREQRDRAEKKIEEMTENIPNLINEIKPQTLEAVGIK